MKHAYRVSLLVDVKLDVAAESREAARKKALACDFAVNGDYEGIASTWPVIATVERIEEEVSNANP